MVNLLPGDITLKTRTRKRTFVMTSPNKWIERAAQWGFCTGVLNLCTFLTFYLQTVNKREMTKFYVFWRTWTAMDEFFASYFGTERRHFIFRPSMFFIWPNKSCKQEFPQIFEVRLNHHECQPIQEPDEKKKQKNQRFHISFIIKPKKQFFWFHRITVKDFSQS